MSENTLTAKTRTTVNFSEAINQQEVKKNKKEDILGLDVGTMNISSCKLTDEISGTMEVNNLRNCYITLDLSAEGMLKMRKMPYFKTAKKLYILGESALQLSQVFNYELKRTLSHGLITTNETDSLVILKEIFKSVLGIGDETTVYYSVPAKSIGSNTDVIYHSEALKSILKELGYKPVPMNEAFSIIISEAAKNQFSGVSISMGAGMINCCLAIDAMKVFEFSLGRSGDWIDESCANSLGTTVPKILNIKESNEANLSTFKGLPHEREIEAILYYYKFLIEYAITNFIKEFNTQVDKSKYDFSSLNIPIIIAGSTSKIKGFIDVFKSIFESKKDEFPIKVSEIVLAEDQAFAVVKGLTIANSLKL